VSSAIEKQIIPSLFTFKLIAVAFCSLWIIAKIWSSYLWKRNFR